MLISVNFWEWGMREKREREKEKKCVYMMRLYFYGNSGSGISSPLKSHFPLCGLWHFLMSAGVNLNMKFSPFLIPYTHTYTHIHTHVKSAYVAILKKVWENKRALLHSIWKLKIEYLTFLFYNIFSTFSYMSLPPPFSGLLSLSRAIKIPLSRVSPI